MPIILVGDSVYLVENQNSIIIKEMPDFNVTHIFECGQCFRWDKSGEDEYTGVCSNRVLTVKQKGSEIELIGTKHEDADFWRYYLDLDRDYGAIKKELSKDKILKEAIKFGWGIRILNQDIWECLISFIISANNRIPMIKRAVKNISVKYGIKIEFKGKDYYSFPTHEQLSRATIEELEACGAGFRAKYIIGAVNAILSGEVNLEEIKEFETEKAREELQKLAGVGPKIADCVLLFSVRKSDAFPIDVWVKRVMEYFYSDKEMKFSQIQELAKEKFGSLSGFAQQYLFYYARELKIGK